MRACVCAGRTTTKRGDGLPKCEGIVDGPLEEVYDHDVAERRALEAPHTQEGRRHRRVAPRAVSFGAHASRLRGV